MNLPALDSGLRSIAESRLRRFAVVLAGGEDQRMPPALQEKVAEASKSPLSRFVTIDGAGHGAAYRVATERYQAEIRAFLERAGL